MRNEVQNYKIQMMKEEFVEKALNPHYKNLSEEVALSRLLIEDLWNSCNDDPLALRACMPILLDSFAKVEKLVSSAHKIDIANDTFMSEAQLGAFCSNVIGVIADNIDDPKAIKDISEGILNLLDKDNESV